MTLIRNPASLSTECALVLLGEKLTLQRIVLNDDTVLTEQDYQQTEE
jgi:hypothetical protein